MADEQAKKVGTGSYVVAGLGFIPAIGILFATAAIILGIVKRKSGGKTLIILGCLGILFTVGIYGTLFYEGFVKRGGTFDALRVRLAKVELTDLVKSIEYYKVTKGRYPASLQELETSFDKKSPTSIYDPTSQDISKIGSGKILSEFFYRLSDDKTHYYLLSVGPDGQPFTGDDLLPDISDQDREKTGLLINPASLPARK